MLSLTVAVPGVAIILFIIKKYFAGGICSADITLEGKTAIITGSTSGIGKETAKNLARRGCRVIIASRNLEVAKQTTKEIQAVTGNGQVFAFHLDLSSFESIHQFVSNFKQSEKRLDILINNAGVFFIPRSITKNGFEKVFQVNYLGHFLLTLLLLDILKASAPSRIIILSSNAHTFCKDFDFLNDINGEKSYAKITAYAQSKLALMLFTRTLSQKLKDFGVTVNSVDPGNVDTPIYRDFPLLSNPILRAIQWPIRVLTFKNSLEGSQTSVFCSVTKELEDVTGKYFRDCKEAKTSPLAENDEIAGKLWSLSLDMVNLEDKF